MMRSLILTGGLALAFLLAPALRAEDDDLRLNIPGKSLANKPAETRTLAMTPQDEDAETLEMRWRGGFVGYRGGFVGYRGWGWGGGWHRPIGWGGGWGWHRPVGWGWGGGWHRPVVVGGFYRGVGIGWGHPGYVGGFYAPPVYTAPIISYGYLPCAVTEATPVTTLEFRIQPAVPAPADSSLPTRPVLPRPSEGTAPRMPNADGTFDYNGGPTNPVPAPPMPPAGERDVMNLPRIPTPITERYVSDRPEPTTGKYVYPAYGETPRRSGK